MVPSVELRVVAFIAISFICTGSCAEDWSYSEPNGQSQWSKEYPTCGGQHQSPIHILNTVKASGPKLQRRNYDNIPVKMNFTNNGHTVVVQPVYNSKEEMPLLSVDEKEFRLSSVHFHWGKDDSEGSEHYIKYTRYALEMHVVHKLLVDGVEKDEYAVMAFLYKEEKNISKNADIDNVLFFATKSKRPNKSFIVKGFSVSSFVPDMTNQFYTYQGSLTTPPCTEAVTWLINKRVGVVSQSKMNGLRYLRNEKGERIRNFRMPQPINDRQVLCVE